MSLDELRRVVSKDDRCQRGCEPVIHEDGSIKIPLTRGQVALVDAGNYPLVKDRRWRTKWDSDNRSFYVVSGGARIPGGGREPLLRLHRIILDAPLDAQVDHVNHDTLDNRLSNLRLVTVSENQRNRKLMTGTTSRFKGVCWKRQRHRWVARIKANGKLRHLGYYDTEEEAARVYDAAARAHFGEHAFTNEMAGILPPADETWMP